MKLLLAFATAALLAGCSTAQSATDTPVTMADITELIGKPEAQSIDSCKVLPIGKKACGKDFLKLEFDKNKPDGQFRKDVCSSKLYETFPDFEFTLFKEGIKKVYEIMKYGNKN
jgi:hypothetical protein